MPDSQPRQPGFESALLAFRKLGFFVFSNMPQFSETHELVSDNRQRWKCDLISLRAVIVTWLNDSQRRRVCVRINRSAGGDV